MPHSVLSRVLVFLTVLGALLTLASWLGRPARLLLFAIVGLLVVQALPVYLCHLLALARQHHRALESIEASGGRITHRLAADPHCILGLDLSQANLSELKWDSLHSLSHLESLNLAHTSATDEQLDVLSRLPCLRHLDLEHTAITDGGLSSLRSFPRLESVVLTDTQVTEEGLERLFHSLPKLHAEAEHLPPLDHLDPLKDVAHDAYF